MNHSLSTVEQSDRTLQNKVLMNQSIHTIRHQISTNRSLTWMSTAYSMCSVNPESFLVRTGGFTLQWNCGLMVFVNVALANGS
jgi:hypothetical protein